MLNYLHQYITWHSYFLMKALISTKHGGKWNMKIWQVDKGQNLPL